VSPARQRLFGCIRSRRLLDNTPFTASCLTPPCSIASRCSCTSTSSTAGKQTISSRSQCCRAYKPPVRPVGTRRTVIPPLHSRATVAARRRSSSACDTVSHLLSSAHDPPEPQLTGQRVHPQKHLHRSSGQSQTAQVILQSRRPLLHRRCPRRLILLPSCSTVSQLLDSLPPRNAVKSKHLYA
jgi:hypothetical protein